MESTETLRTATFRLVADESKDEDDKPYKEAGDVLRDLMERKDESQKDVAKKVGCSSAAVGHWTTGHSWPRKPEYRAKLRKAGYGAYVDKISAFVAEDRDLRNELAGQHELRAGEIPPLSPDDGYVPVVGAASAGPFIEAINAGRKATGERHYEHIGKFARAGRFGVIVRGKSMTGSGYEDGDVVVVDALAHPVHGKSALVFVDGEVTIKEFRKYQDRVVLRATNPDFEPHEMELEADEQEERITWARPIVFHKPRGRE